MFLVGLQKVGKGDWRGISRNFVKTRTPTQVASHAQKYFLRRTNHNRRRRRSSLFDITTDTVPFYVFYLNLIPLHKFYGLKNISGQIYQINCRNLKSYVDMFIRWLSLKAAALELSK